MDVPIGKICFVILAFVFFYFAGKLREARGLDNFAPRLLYSIFQSVGFMCLFSSFGAYIHNSPNDTFTLWVLSVLALYGVTSLLNWNDSRR